MAGPRNRACRLRSGRSFPTGAWKRAGTAGSAPPQPWEYCCHAERRSASASASYAPRGELTPGILAVGAQAVVPLVRPGPGGSPIGLEGVLGFGGLRYDGTTGRELAIECGAPDCFEGVFFRGGWSQVVELGLGLEVPLSRAWFARPSAGLHIPLGDTSDGPGHGVLRIGVGIGFR